jgi:hypothetical protein
MSRDSLYASLTRDGGTRIRLDRLASLVAGIFATALGTGLADLVSGVIQWWIVRPIEGIGSFYAEVIRTTARGLGWIADGAWNPLIALVEALGPFAFPAALVVSIAIGYMIVKARDYSA